ncbi:EAL domain-containing protein [Pseudomonas oryzihabitans]|uniref:putative bifunctional diguanylate cyclase/phosphodiesterase n=1 Tax=Pseudomonas oryzihabitans TaxID=47885 RepID=UPI0018D5BDA2|nr:EAL domain-containing protein [Pseudomonas oryzihabitans]MBH3329919.1 EAL domain-containing protein [Pseudomonas oryzihabitans]
MDVNLMVVSTKARAAKFSKSIGSTSTVFSISHFPDISFALAALNAGGSTDVIVLVMTRRILKPTKILGLLNAAANSIPPIPVVVVGAESLRARVDFALKQGAYLYISDEVSHPSVLVQALQDVWSKSEGYRMRSSALSRARITLDSISDGVIGTDSAGKVEYINPAAEKLTGWPKELAKGKPVGDVMKVKLDGAFGDIPHPVELALGKRAPTGLSAGAVLLRRNGGAIDIEDSTAPMIDETGAVTGAVIVFHDVSMERAMKAKMTYLAEHDQLTHLPNRLLFRDRAAQSLRSAVRNQSSVAILFLDLDNFKVINDSLGHSVGDKLLISVAARLSSCVREEDTVSRQGGDEFLVLLAGLKSREATEGVAQKIISRCKEPHLIDGHDIHITISLGIGFSLQEHIDIDALIAQADTAMYRTKQNGRNGYTFFSEEIGAQVQEQRKIEEGLRRCIDLDEIRLVYQPKIDLSSGTVVGVEALMRWTNNALGEVAPTRFIPVAETTRLMIALGRWAIKEACTQIGQWKSLGLGDITVAVNVSALELEDDAYVEYVSTVLSDCKLDPGLLQLEVTETVFIKDLSKCVVRLGLLKEAGVLLALDDFGIGYSSFSYLTRMPFDFLKIDRSFVHDVELDSGRVAVVGAMLSMAKSLGLTVIAEGIETSAEADFFINSGCDQAQGFFFSKPLEAMDMPDFLRQQRSTVG